MADARAANGRGWRDWAVVAIGVALLLGVIALAGHPTVFTDTDDYYALGRELAIDAGIVAPPELSEFDIAQAKYDAHMGHTQMASRSAVYGMFFYAVESAGTLWLVALAQALAVAWPLTLLWRAAVPRAPFVSAVALFAVVALLTPAAFFAGFAMPDILAGVAPIIAVLLLVYPERLRRGEAWGLAALLVFALAVHTAHVLTMVPLLGVAAIFVFRLGLRRRIVARRLAAVGVCVGAAILSSSLYGIGVRLTTGEPLRNQPFLAARVLADGPGRAYLRHACAAGEKYALCAFAQKPLADSEDILWSDLPATGVFMLSNYATRMAIEGQEGRFVLGTVAFAPGAQLAASLRNLGRQLALVFVDDPVRDPVFYLTDPYWKQTNLPGVIARVANCGPRHTGCRSRLTVAESKWWHGGWLLVALAAIVVEVVPQGRKAAVAGDRQVGAAVVLLLAAVVLNAGVCGVLSGPFARYQARIVWLVPVAACLLVAARRWPREGAPPLAA